MPKPKSWRDRLVDAVQIGVPETEPSSTRPPEATPTPTRLAAAEEWLRAGARISDVSYHTGMSRAVVRIIAQGVLLDWQFPKMAGVCPTVFQIEHMPARADTAPTGS